MIGRMYQIHPTQLELYSLRLLLNNVKGATSFKELRSVNGKPCETFHAAAIARNLLKNDKIWIDCMNEASETETNIHRLRQLFVTVLVNCEVANPAAFYDKCKGCLMEDYAHQYSELLKKFPQLNQHLAENASVIWTLEQYALNSCLFDLQKLLSEQERSLAGFGLPEPDLEHEQLIQNCLMERHVVVEDNAELSAETAKAFFNKN